MIFLWYHHCFNPFVLNALFLYPLKTENHKVFWCFQGAEKRCIGDKWVKWISQLYFDRFHCVKSVHIWSFSGPHIPAFGLNTEIYRVNLRILSECGEIRTRKIPNMDTFKQCLIGYFLKNHLIFLWI